MFVELKFVSVVVMILFKGQVSKVKPRSLTSPNL